MHRLIIVVTLFLAAGVGAQDISWKTAGATLPKTQYTLHVSRDGELYAYSQVSDSGIYRYSASTRDWRKVRDGSFAKLQVISPDLAYAVEVSLQPTLTVFTEGFNKALAFKDTSGEAIQVRDYAIGLDTVIYVIPFDQNLIRRSTDLGNSWATLAGSAGMYYRGLTIDAHNSVYTWNTAGLVRLKYSAIIWEDVLVSHPGEVVVTCTKTNENIFVVTSNGNLYKNGDSLAALTEPKWYTIRDGSLLEHGRGASLYYHPPFSSPLYSLDGGKQWDTLRINGKPLSAGCSIACDSTGVVYAAPNDEKELNHILVSSDNGASWIPLTLLLDQFSFIGCSSEDVLYGKDATGILSSTNNGEWWEAEHVPGIKRIYSTSIGVDGELFAVCRTDSNTVVLGTKVTKSTPWRFTSPMPQQDAITPYRVSGRFPTGELWAADEEGFFSVEETDGSWRSSVVLDVPGNGIRGAAVIDPTTIVVAGFAEIYRSTDKGKKFQKVFSLRNEETGMVVTSNDTRCYVLTDHDRLLHSSDKGATWEIFVTPTSDQHIDVAILPTETVFLSTSAGVFMNKSGFNNTFTWEDISGKLEGFRVVNLAQQGTKRLYAGTMGGNVYFTDLPGSSVSKPGADDHPIVYPNPALDRCYLYGVDASAEVAIYDLLGIRVLHTIYDGQLDVSNIPAGVYQVVAGNSRANLVIHR